jgi:hypothetical protein
MERGSYPLPRGATMCICSGRDRSGCVATSAPHMPFSRRTLLRFGYKRVLVVHNESYGAWIGSFSPDEDGGTSNALLMPEIKPKWPAVTVNSTIHRTPWRSTSASNTS